MRRRTGREAALKYLCDRREGFKLFLAVVLTFLLFTVVSLFAVDPTTSTYVITVVNFATLSVVSVIAVAVIVGCGRYLE